VKASRVSPEGGRAGKEWGFVKRGRFLRREWKSEWVTDDESGESTEEDEVTCVGRRESHALRRHIHRTTDYSSVISRPNIGALTPAEVHVVPLLWKVASPTAVIIHVPYSSTEKDLQVVRNKDWRAIFIQVRLRTARPLFIRLHRMHRIDAVCCYRMSHVTWSVYLCVCLQNCLNGSRHRLGNHWGSFWRQLAKTIERSVCGGHASLCQITLTTSSYRENGRRRENDEWRSRQQ